MSTPHSNSHAVPLTETLLNVAEVLAATRRLAIAEVTLEQDVGIRRSDEPHSWRYACQAKFQSGAVMNALSQCGLPHTSEVFDKLMQADQWPREVLVTEELSATFVFDPSHQVGLIRSKYFDMSRAPKAVLLAQVNAFVSEQQIENSEIFCGAGTLSALQNHPFVRGVSALPEHERDEVARAMYLAVETRRAVSEQNGPEREKMRA